MDDRSHTPHRLQSTLTPAQEVVAVALRKTLLVSLDDLMAVVERFNGRIEEVLQSHHFRSGEELETTMRRFVRLYNQQLPQSALGSKSPMQAMKDWHKLNRKLFRKRPYYLPGCDT